MEQLTRALGRGQRLCSHAGHGFFMRVVELLPLFSPVDYYVRSRRWAGCPRIGRTSQGQRLAGPFLLR
jgi:hypothetical protein